MNLPSPLEGNQIVMFPEPLLEQDRAAYSALSVETYSATSSLSELLQTEPFDLSTTYIGPAKIMLGQILIETRDRYWVLERSQVEFTPCEHEAIGVLAEAGYDFDADHVRFAHQTRPGWHPWSTMREVVACPRVFHGPVATEGCSIAVGFVPDSQVMAGQAQWAAWVAVHVGRLVYS